jgi:2-keto-4-pentenoate hydratase/2-oxohepta-3-ene-1,7-dioic acid hydratase in catechol pathway
VKLAVFSTGADLRAGVADLDQGVIRDVTGVLGDTDLAAVLGSWDTIRPALEGELASRPAVPLDSVQLHAPLRPVRNIFCVGKNYSDHVREFGRSGYDTPERSEAIPEAPVIFSKATTSVTGPFDDIDPHHGVTKELDYEAELGVIIGRGGRGITQEHAFEHVWGYTIIDDFTARDLQRQHKQWLLGKSLDTHCPLGPYAVSADEIADVTALVVESRVNGELRQSAPVADLIFDIPTLIETISAGITLLPGDIIATGTPAGVGIGFDPPRFMTSGDTIEISITGLGTQRNRIA